jgi:hypothetical protein
MGAWTSDSFDGIPAGLVHRNDDDEYGRPAGPACGAGGGYYFASRSLEDVPPSWRCVDCDDIGAG